MSEETYRYRLGALDRSGFIAGLGIAEVVIIGTVLSITMLLGQLFGWPQWSGLIPAFVAWRALVRARPGQMHMTEYWSVLTERLRRWVDPEWFPTSNGDLPPALDGLEFVAMDQSKLGAIGARAIQPPGAVLDHSAGSLSLVFEVEFDSFLMMSQPEQAAAVDRWAQVLSGTAGGATDMYLSVETVVTRSTAEDHWDYLQAQAGDRRDGLVTRSYRDLVERHSGTARSTQVLLTFTLSMKSDSAEGSWGTELASTRRSGRKKLLNSGAVAALEIQRRLSLFGFDGSRMLSVTDLNDLLLVRIDPDTARGRSAQHDRSLGVWQGVAGDLEGPEHIIFDTNFVVINGVAHWTGWANKWPDELVDVDWGVRLFGEFEGEIRSITYSHPVDPSDSRKRHRSDLARHEGDRLTAEDKSKPVSLETQRALDEVTERGEELRSGHRELEQVTLVSVSASTPELLRRRVDTLRAWLDAHGIGIYPLKGAQALAWGHSLPFGMSPTKIRGRWD